MSQRDKWRFEPVKDASVSGYAGTLMLGGYYIADILSTAGVAAQDWQIGTPHFGTPEFVERIVKVLNRELPEGKLSVRHKEGAK